MNLDTFENLRLELRRGCLVLAVLAKLRSEYHGYALVKVLKEGGVGSTKTPCTPYCAGWKNKSCWSANGASRISEINGSIAFPMKANRCWNRVRQM